MSWRHTEPCRSDFDSDEDYEAALDNYDSALDDYVDAYLESRRG